MKSCPQCHLLLESACIEGVDFLVCRGCGGSWHAAETVPCLLSGNLGVVSVISSEFPGISASGMYDGLRQLCPDCRTKTLVLEDHPECGGKELFTCPSCSGIWLRASDRLELLK